MSFIPKEIPEGAIRYNTDSNKMELWIGEKWMIVDTSSPDLNGGARGVFGGSYTYGPGTRQLSNFIDYITIPSAGNAIDFGDLTETRGVGGAGSSRTRGVFCGGDINPSPNKTSNVVDFITIETQGNAADFGDLTQKGGHGNAVMSNQTRICCAGRNSQPGVQNIIDFATIASTGNFIDFGDTDTAIYGVSGASNGVRGIISNGDLGPTYDLTIRYITIPTTGNSEEFGEARYNSSGPAALSSSTRCLIGSGSGPANHNAIEYITMATLGNTTDFGENDFSQPHRFPGAATDCVRGVFAGGYGSAPTYTTTTKIDYVKISTLGNGIDFGDLSAAAAAHMGCSNGHGGL